MKKLFIALALGMSFDTNAQAKPSVNDMQGCQAVIDFVDTKIETLGDKYSAADIDIVRTGLQGYNDYIQTEIVTPGLLDFNRGDADKAKAMQIQVDAYKASVTQGLFKRYPQERLFADHAMSINNCAQKAVPEGADLEALKAALFKIIELAKQE